MSELEKLKAQNKLLEAKKKKTNGDRFLKKTRRDRKEAVLSQVRYETIYLAIQELHDTKAYPITELCEIAGIQRSSYYKWLNRKESETIQFNKELTSTY